MRVQKNQFFFGLELTRAGETVPDIEKCDRLAKFYDITIDALLHQENTVGNTAKPANNDTIVSDTATLAPVRNRLLSAVK